jgi:serine/threonine protein kinase
MAVTSMAAKGIAESDPLIGRTISGRYRVEKLLGRGGMGKVYQAKQIPLERDVALKVLNSAYTGEEDSEFHKRFFQEAAVMAKFTSPHTVTVFDYGRDRNLYYMAMELVSGEPLDRVLADGPMRPERVIAIAQQVCRSLREAHSKGIVHRDLKPGNVILTTGHEGEELIKLMDFGLAKRMATLGNSNPNVVPGSPKYMSPEVIRQQTVDGRADIYALGVMLYHMLTGVVPFDRDNPIDILNAHLNEEPPPMKSVYPSIQVPPALERLTMRCLAKDPAKRFANMQRVLDALRVAAAEMGFSIHSGLLATSLIPPSKAEKENAPPSAAVSLRVAPDETRPEKKRKDTGVKKNSARIFAVGAFTLFVLAAGLYFAQVKPPATSGHSAAEKPGLLASSTRQTTSGSTATDMVFTVDDLNRQNTRAQVAISSKPAGASVSFEGKLIGLTPTTYDWRGEQAARGQILELHFSKPGYYPYVVKKTIDSEKLRIHVILIAREAARTALSPAKPPADQSEKNKPQALPSGPETERAEESPPAEQVSLENDNNDKITKPEQNTDEQNTETESPEGERAAPEDKGEVTAPAQAQTPPASPPQPPASQ